MYKYMTWTSGKYFEGNQLIRRDQVKQMLEVFKHTKLEQFVTIQDYDSEGNIIGCPLYFDIDAPSLYDAHEEMQFLVAGIQCELEVDPWVYFSGGKGYHVIAPLYIRHPRCHEIVKIIWKDLFPNTECDPKVYRTRAMFRCNDTWNIKGEGYKVQIQPQRTIEEAVRYSKQGVHDPHNSLWNQRDLDITKYIDQLPVFNPRKLDGGLDFHTDMMPCLKKLWENPDPPEGMRHELAYLMVRHCFTSDISREDAEAIFAAHPFWSGVERRDYEKIIRSVYQTGNASLGCKHNELLQRNCIKFCKYNTGISVFDTFKRDAISGGVQDARVPHQERC